MHTTQCVWRQGTAMYLGYMKVAWQLWEENWEGGSLVPKSFPPPLLAVCGGRLALWRSGHIQWRNAMEGSTRNMNYYSRPPATPCVSESFLPSPCFFATQGLKFLKTSFPLEKNILLKFFTPLAPTKFLQIEPPLFLTTSDQNHFLNSSTLTEADLGGVRWVRTNPPFCWFIWLTGSLLLPAVFDTQRWHASSDITSVQFNSTCMQWSNLFNFSKGGAG